MADPDDPMNPEAWFAEPGVCGSCVAWRPIDPGPDDDVAVGLCRLRPELRRVPATLAKCPKYNQRGGFKYQPSAERSAPRRRRAGPLVIKRRNEAGELVDVAPAVSERATRPRTPRPNVGDGPLDQAIRPTGPRIEPVYRPFPETDPPPASALDIGTESSALVSSALVDLIREELSGRPRDMASKYRHGGRVRVETEEGPSKSIPAHQFFAWVERLARSLDLLEEAVDTHPAIGPEAEEWVDIVRKMRGSFTTFNVLFSSREDYFSGKA